MNIQSVSVLNDIGLISLGLAFLYSLYSIFGAFYGARKQQFNWVVSARNATVFVFGFLTIATTAIVYSLYTVDFSLAYVAKVSSTAMSPFLRLTALWGGQQGSILFWAWLMSGFIAVVMVRKWESDRELIPYFIMVSMITTGFFIGLSLFIENPFARLWHMPGAPDLITSIFPPKGAMPYSPGEGDGLNPLLRHFGMIGHPPTTYLGFTGFVIPYAFAMATMFTGRSSSDEWIRTTRRWTLVAWIFLSVGLILGGRWAYDVLGWGGFWGWDPIENAMLMPWLTGTAFLHSVMMTEKRGMLKKWNMILIILTYSLSLFGTFITRTGVVSSVHAFSTSALGPAFFTFIGLTFLGSLSLLFYRWNTLKSEHELESWLSREAVFLLQNLLFLSITFAVFWGTVFPLLSELFTGTKMTVGPPYFLKVTGPLFGGLLLTMGIAPLMSWRKQVTKKLGRALALPILLSLIIAGIWAFAQKQHPGAWVGLWISSFVTLSILNEFRKGIQTRISAKDENFFQATFKLISRNRRRYGGYLIHLAVIMIGLGFIGDANFKQETQGTLSTGEFLTIGDYSLQFNGLDYSRGTDGREILEADTTLYYKGNEIKELKPRRDYFVIQEQPVTIPGVYSTFGKDIYVLLVGWEQINLESSTFKIYMNPLINWVWIGGLLMIIGTSIAAWPPREDAKQTYRLRRSAMNPIPYQGVES